MGIYIYIHIYIYGAEKKQVGIYIHIYIHTYTHINVSFICWVGSDGLTWQIKQSYNYTAGKFLTFALTLLHLPCFDVTCAEYNITCQFWDSKLIPTPILSSGR